ncbi:MAG: hypothetical protein COU90_04675 [Candidatus Ryanbacteria bacterium CG10_big_fil_rev_8_21_14_0_10_43_42]|uniref:Uncharacterized protein n=1 Tax=Candidatus Ryanbacteria bacterium CG10_big_fil_rev_8_21_14_0_10_43_42 TaxID=1974864 RepID=A0A2M8KW42_9BACT|nr:MAG: hypothetical protein COU90_04675 [Candidatus Ryanbacteria bacterium CG10_big_fil_rev_8_21_14_0_10_43_42]
MSGKKDQITWKGYAFLWSASMGLAVLSIAVLVIYFETDMIQKDLKIFLGITLLSIFCMICHALWKEASYNAYWRNGT